MSWADAKQAFDNGDTIFLNDPNRATLSVAYYDSEAHALVTEESLGIAYFWYNPNPFA